LGYTDENPIPLIRIPKNDFIASITMQPSKVLVLELLAAVLIATVFITLARKIKSGKPVTGAFWNMLEAACIFVRDDIVRPSIGSKDADQFLPFIWTIFFFVLTLNLLGMIPVLGAATGSLSVTAALALIVFGVVLYTGMKKMGAVGFWKAQAPHIDLSGPLKYILVPMIWVIEVFGLFIKHLVLAVRLFANMFAGHLVLAVFVGFIAVAWASPLLFAFVAPASIIGSVGIGLLELLVALIQAYVFAFLSALFIGAAIHPH
jgi:F-type H+-transporting ATPase subunit a